jgi:hypothetical protein
MVVQGGGAVSYKRGTPVCANSLDSGGSKNRINQERSTQGLRQDELTPAGPGPEKSEISFQNIKESESYFKPSKPKMRIDVLF